MPTLKSVMDTLKSKGSEKTRAIYVRHGMPAGRLFGVSIADLKLIAKTIKGDQALAWSSTPQATWTQCTSQEW
jgi:hypothetical protein